MKKRKIISALLAFISVCCLSLSSCALGEARGVLSIEKTATNGLVDTYTVYYTDGTSSTFEIKNGADGKDGEDGKDGKDGKDGESCESGAGGESVTIESIYEQYKKEYGEISYAEFLSLYLTFENNDYTVIGNCLRSSAKVYTQFTEISYVFRPGGSSTTTAAAIYTGSSVIYRIDEDYTYFLTNYHVIYDGDSTTKTPEQIHVYLYGSEGAPTKVSSTEYNYGEYAIACEFVGGSVNYDVAVLKAETKDVFAINENVQAVEFAEEYYVGQTAIAIGNPDNAGISVTKGVVSVDNDYITLNIDGTTREYRSIRMDTALYNGNSGGGLFNEKGQIIGLNNAGNGTEENINYAIPVSIVKGVADNVLYYAEDGDDETNGVYKMTLGISVSTEKSRYVYDETKGYGKIMEDILLASIESGSVAEKLGLQVGDRLVSVQIGDTMYALNRSFDIGDVLFLLTVGESVSFVYERAGEEYTTENYTVQSSDIKFVA